MAKITPKSESVPKAAEPYYQAIIELTDDVCGRLLNEEYAALARSLAAALARKRPTPILRGRPGTWACGIVYALGTVNFLFDKSQTPHLTADELSAAFGVSKSTGANKAKQIRDIFGMYQLDPNWSLPSRMDRNPLVWMLEVNGLVVDVRYMPLEVQEIAFRKGLIPYIPGDPNREK